MTWIVLTLVASFSCTEADAGALSRAEALERLKSSGFKWRQTEVLQLEADAKSQLAHSASYPQLQIVSRQYVSQYSGLRYGLAAQTVPSFLQIGSSSLELIFLLFDGAARERMKAANENQKLTAFQIQLYQNDMTALTFLHYTNAQRFHRRFENMEASVARSEEILKIAKQRLQTGAGLKLDVLRAEAMVAAENLKRLDAYSANQRAKQELATLMGLTEVTDDLEPLRFKDFDPSPQTKESNEIESRPDVQAARLMLSTANYLKNAAVKDGLPRVAFAADLGFIGTQTFLGFGPGAFNGSAAIQVSVPIYTGGRLTSRESEEAAKVAKADLNLSQTELEARSQIKLVLDQIKTARAAVSAASQAVEAASEELRLAKQRFKGGAASGIDVRNAVVGLSTTSEAYADAVFGFEATKIHYFRIMFNFGSYLQLARE